MNETDSWRADRLGGRNNEQSHGGDVRRVVGQQCVPSLRRRSSVACLAASGYCATRGPAAVAVGRVMALAIALPSALARQALYVVRAFRTVGLAI
jgi:hypothetical protein